VDQFMQSVGLVVFRLLLILVAVFIVSKCFSSMRRRKRPESPLVTLYNETTKRKIPVVCWENAIGRSRGSDIVIDDPTVSRNHCVLLRRKEGWFVSDVGSKSGTKVNGRKISKRRKIKIDDKITIGKTTLSLKKRAENEEDLDQYWFFTNDKKRKTIAAPWLVIFLNIFYILMAVGICISQEQISTEAIEVLIALIAFSWLMYTFSRAVFKRSYFELEILALMLMGTGSLLLVGQDIKDAWVQIISAFIGAALYFSIIAFIENPDRIVKWRMAVMLVALGFLAINLAFGKVEYGAANRIYIAGVSIQPSEIVKIAYIFVGASALDHLQTKRNILEFIIFSALCVGALGIMGDFGTALIFFVTFIVISITRSGDIKTAVFALVGAAFAVILILRFKPYIADRFEIWGNVMDDPYGAGYQQSRVLTYLASGGLFGVGVGGGKLRDIVASETDLVFGIVGEEMGFITAVLFAMVIFGLVLYSRAITTRSRSTFYSISACCAASMMLVQTGLNIFGCTDILPLTGVTLPFVSAGGSSMISCFGLLAFIKAADEGTYTRKKLPL